MKNNKHKFKVTAMMAAIESIMGENLFSKNKDELSGIDIKKEYDLIKEKKSKLSSRMRNLVIYEYEKIR